MDPAWRWSLDGFEAVNRRDPPGPKLFLADQNESPTSAQGEVPQALSGQVFPEVAVVAADVGLLVGKAPMDLTKVAGTLFEPPLP